METAMLELMKKVDFEKITVKGICEKAGVNRSTFYAHFIDIYDMMNQMENRLHSELLESYRSGEERIMFSEESLYVFLRHIRKHRHFYKIALRTRRDFPLKQGFEPLWNQIVKPQCQRAGISSEDEMMYYFVYFQAGFTIVLRRWVEGGCRHDERDIAGIIKKCIPSAAFSN